MDQILKSACVGKQAVSEEALALINRQTLRPLAAEEVFTFRLAACDTKPDRDHERFSRKSLEGLAKLFVGRPVLRDHQWSAGAQTARIYAAEVEERGEDARLVLRAYMPRTETAADTISAIEAGILREASVGCLMKKAVCSICGADKAEWRCEHVPGRDYGGKTCVVELDEVEDAYEVSLCAVPVQPGAGVIKSYGGEKGPLPAEAGNDEAFLLAQAMQEQEEMRYGGFEK